MSRELAFPLTVSPAGNFSYLTDPNRVIGQHIEFVVLTRLRERVMQPEIGNVVLDSVFDPMSEILISQLRSDLMNVLMQQLPQVTVTRVDLIADELNASLTVIIEYQYGGGPVQTTTVLTHVPTS